MSGQNKPGEGCLKVNYRGTQGYLTLHPHSLRLSPVNVEQVKIRTQVPGRSMRTESRSTDDQSDWAKAVDLLTLKNAAERYGVSEKVLAELVRGGCVESVYLYQEPYLVVGHSSDGIDVEAIGTYAREPGDRSLNDVVTEEPS